MTGNLLQQLEKFVEEDPADPFNWYALALEYQKTNPEKAIALYEKLLTDFEHYVPTYYHAGHLFNHVGETEKAINVFEKGIAEARKQNDLKAAKELRSALDELLF